MPFNRPKFSACATWNPNAITFADNSALIQAVSEVFITANNTIYATSFGLDSVLVWAEDSRNLTARLFGNLNFSHRIIVNRDGDVYAEDGLYHFRIMKWEPNATDATVFMNISGPCGGLFIDIYNYFYCSHTSNYRVWKRPIDDDGNSSLIIAGTGVAGSAPDMLNSAYGIFVDIDLSLYVADFDNNRVQLFRRGQPNGTAVAGAGAPDTISLSNPIAVVLDGDGYLFITDYMNHRIVGSGPNGFRCIVGCTGTSGSAANQFNLPRALSFDSYGNFYVADASNARIQKFALAKNNCGESFRAVISNRDRSM